MVKKNQQKKQFVKILYIRLQSVRLSSLQESQYSIKNLALKTECGYSSINLPIIKKKINVLKSPHVNKKARDQFEIKFYNRLLVVKSFHFSLNFWISLNRLFNEDTSVKLLFKSKKND
jgi:ribosomal protein S10